MKLLMVMLSGLLCVESVSAVAPELSEIIVPAAVLSAPLLIAAYARYKHTAFEKEVIAYKATLNQEELAVFEEEFSPEDIWILTSATRALVAVAGAGFFVSSLPLALGGFNAAMVAAGLAQYIERQNSKNFTKICIALEKKRAAGHKVTTQPEDSAQ